jgi:DNA sulfur modification protein DndB
MRGASQDEHTFIGIMHASQLFAFAPDPMRIESVSKGKANEPDLEEISRVRVDVQRMFEGAKKRNVPSYAEYIKRLYRGQIDGATPVIELWCQELLPDGSSPNEKVIPWGTKFIAIDGETQLAARYVACAEEPMLKRVNIPVRVHHGRPPEWARQSFHDFNTLAVKPNTAVAISMDQRNPLTMLALKIEAEVPQLRGRVHHTARQLNANDKHIVTVSSLRTAVVTFIAGSPGIQSSFRLGGWDELPPRAPERAVQWFRAIFDSFAKYFEPETRKSNIMPVPAAMAALGVIGHTLLTPPHDTMDDERIGESIARAIDALGRVDWTRGRHWDGIAGTVSPSGGFSTAGGVKEHTYAILKALTNKRTPEYYQLREQLVPADVQAAPDGGQDRESEYALADVA